MTCSAYNSWVRAAGLPPASLQPFFANSGFEDSLCLRPADRLIEAAVTCCIISHAETICKPLCNLLPQLHLLPRTSRLPKPPEMPPQRQWNTCLCQMVNQHDHGSFLDSMSLGISMRLTLRESPPPADTEASIIKTSHLAGPTMLYSKVLRGPLVLTTCEKEHNVLLWRCQDSVPASSQSQDHCFNSISTATASLTLM